MNRPLLPATRPLDGFTLIELMITVAIVAILAAIAIPSYQDSVWKGKRGEAKAAIFRTLQTEERFYTQNNSYYWFPQSGTTNPPFSTYSADNANNSRYTISVEYTPLTLTQGASSVTSCSANDATKCVRVVATVQGTTADPTCGNKLYMDTTGAKMSAVYNAKCWN